MQVNLVDVFTTTPGQGNPAAVVIGRLSVGEMQHVAATTGLETTFVDGTQLTYVQPSGAPMTLCGHGTLAALSVLDRQGPFTITAPAGELSVNVDSGLLGLAMPPVTLGEELDPAVAAAGLEIEPGAIDGPVLVGSAGRPKLIVPLRSVASLDGLQPSQAAVDACCKAVNATGIYAFTRQERVMGATADARHFCTGAGIYEDPATGVAAVVLAWYLWHYGVLPGCVSVKIAQGHAMGRPSLIMARQENGRVWIYGQAVRGGTREL
jgi:PhzF family phenazine biosynthesis protein